MSPCVDSGVCAQFLEHQPERHGGDQHETQKQREPEKWVAIVRGNELDKFIIHSVYHGCQEDSPKYPPTVRCFLEQRSRDCIANNAGGKRVEQRCGKKPCAQKHEYPSRTQKSYRLDSLIGDHKDIFSSCKS